MISKHNTFQSDNLHTSTTTIWLSGRKNGELVHAYPMTVCVKDSFSKAIIYEKN